METHTAGRRILPPVPRAASRASATPGPLVDPVLPLSLDPVLGTTLAARSPMDDAGQAFVVRLRAAAPAFAAAAGARTAVVREVVPPARHRRSRCRVVLRHADGTETDLTVVGDRRLADAGRPEGFDVQIISWLRAGLPREPGWLIADRDALDGTAVDLTAWLADT